MVDPDEHAGAEAAWTKGVPDGKSTTEDGARSHPPLSGVNLWILRSGPGALRACDQLERLGAHVTLEPILTIVGEPLSAHWLATATRVPYHWTLFSSAQAVHFAIRAMRAQHVEISQLGGRVAVVGAATRQALQEYGIPVALEAVGLSNQQGMARAFEHEAIAGTRLLWFTGDRNRQWLAERLTEAGASVDQVQVYRNQVQVLSSASIARVRARGWQGVLYSSSSVVEELLNQLDGGTIEVLRQTNGFSIGPETSRTLKTAGFAVVGEASTPSWGALTAAVTQYFQNATK